ncbi:MAG: hypothetical protein AAF787_00115 [Chloroflexota bacterium]
MNRKPIIVAWAYLMMTVTGWQRGLVPARDVINTHQTYQDACREASEGHFELTVCIYAEDIIPETYPFVPVCGQDFVVGAQQQFIMAAGVNENNPCDTCGSMIANRPCNGSGFYDLDVPVGHPEFSKVYRCPNNPADEAQN